ncbi:hypothetical protein JD969_04490 [Planctomycetota bacterium]|nr:hypothetical protein JD969_04490 [Planctomycetota bacterium]
MPELETIWHAYHAVQNGQYFSEDQRISSSLWLKFYRKRKWYLQNSLKMMNPDAQFEEMQQQLEAAMDSIMERDSDYLQKLGAEKGQEAIIAYVQSVPEVQEMMQLFSEFQQGEKNIDVENIDPELELLGAFNCTVHLPCMILYGELHFNLYRQARSGDLQAIDKLLRLDKGLLRDPLIVNQVHMLLLSADEFKRKMISNAIVGKPSPPFTMKKLKVHYATYVAVAAEQAGYKLDSFELRALFDAVSRDWEGKLVDRDLPDSPDAISKAIQRHKPIVKTWFSHFSGKKVFAE